MHPPRIGWDALFTAKKTTVEMLEDRGYPIPDDERRLFLDIAPSAEGIMEARQRFIAFMNEEEDPDMDAVTKVSREYAGRHRNVMVLFKDAEDNKFGNDLLQSLMTRKGFLHIMVHSENLTKSTFDRISLEDDVQFFKYENLFINPVRHVFTPRHELLSDEEKMMVCLQMKTTLSNLPNIREGDPVIKYYGWKAGGMIKVRQVNMRQDSIVPYVDVYQLIIPGAIEEAARSKKAAAK